MEAISRLHCPTLAAYETSEQKAGPHRQDMRIETAIRTATKQTGSPPQRWNNQIVQFYFC